MPGRKRRGAIWAAEGQPRPATEHGGSELNWLKERATADDLTPCRTACDRGGQGRPVVDTAGTPAPTSTPRGEPTKPRITDSWRVRQRRFICQLLLRPSRANSFTASRASDRIDVVCLLCLFWVMFVQIAGRSLQLCRA
jgi:hypothetical protein